MGLLDRLFGRRRSDQDRYDGYQQAAPQYGGYQTSPPPQGGAEGGGGTEEAGALPHEAVPSSEDAGRGAAVAFQLGNGGDWVLRF